MTYIDGHCASKLSIVCVYKNQYIQSKISPKSKQLEQNLNFAKKRGSGEFPGFLLCLFALRTVETTKAGEPS